MIVPTFAEIPKTGEFAHGGKAETRIRSSTPCRRGYLWRRIRASGDRECRPAEGKTPRDPVFQTTPCLDQAVDRRRRDRR